MKLKTLLIAGVTFAVVGMTVAGCQTYDFEPVEPLAIAQTTEREAVRSRKKNPNIMLLVDKSGSMKFPVDGSDRRCPANCNDTGGLCPADCPLRLDDMQSAMQDFLGQYGTTARFGLSVFPGSTGSDACTTGLVDQEITVSNDVDSELRSAATQINEAIQKLNKNGGLPVTGGTPTAATLNLLANNSVLLDPERDNFVLLLTDGLPNCNANLNGTTCVCVTGEAKCDPRNCLDQDAVVQAISGLSSQDVRTIVVGFGADTGASLGRSALNAMAQAGGFARTCQTNADCGANDTCDSATGTCGTKFYQAANASELAEALTRIQSLIGNQNPCEFRLRAAPTDERFLAVYLDDQRLDSGQNTWSYTNQGTPTVTFSGDSCNRLTTAVDPVEVEIRIIEGL